MIYLELLIGFLKVGCFAFGGAYAAIPFIRDVVLSYGWMTDETLSYMIAVSESTPGPIMINLATFVGTTRGGIPGALIATGAVILPSFIIIILVTMVLQKFLNNRYVNAVLMGLKPCVIGIILATGIYMAVMSILPAASAAFDWRAPVITAVLAVLMFGSKKLFKKKISPILLIVVSAVLGIGLYSF